MADHNVLRLCRQVEHALALALSGEDMTLESVEPSCAVASRTRTPKKATEGRPSPTASRLLVTVMSREPRRAIERIATIQQRLRADVAAAISRRRVPELVFRVLVPV